MLYPDYLYHYTSIETLALILKNRTIRFNNLLYVDDPDEKKSKDIKSVGRFCLVSCWTDVNKESLPMWKLYTPDMHGVRIRMKPFPFKEYPAMMQNFWHVEGEEDIYSRAAITINSYKSYIDEKRVARENRAFVIPPSVELVPVEYTDDETKIYPKIKMSDDFRIDYIGMCKRTYWEFQSEWRYKILFTPFNAAEIKEGAEKNKEVGISKRVPYKEFFLELANNAFYEAEIILGPKVTEGEKIIVESLINTYCKNEKVTVKKSQILVN